VGGNPRGRFLMIISSKLTDKCLRGHDPEFNVNHFLFEQNSFLKDYVIEGYIPGNLINKYCSDYDLNQRLVLIRLQIEQGLIGKKNVSEVKSYFKWVGWRTVDGKKIKFAVNLFRREDVYKPKENEVIEKVVEMYPIDWACGCGVPDDGVNNTYKGFKNQIEGCCKTYNNWFKYFKKGMENEILDKDVNKATPESAIVFTLLKYTPHIGIIKTNEDYWLQYFKSF
jgi:hypothetical protein